MSRFDTEQIKQMVIVLIIFSFAAFLVFCIYKYNSEYIAKIEKVTRIETKYLLPENKIIYKTNDEIEMK